LFVLFIAEEVEATAVPITKKVEERSKESVGQVVGILLQLRKFCGHSLIEGTPRSGHGFSR